MKRTHRSSSQSTSCIFVSVMLASVPQHILTKHVSRSERVAANEQSERVDSRRSRSRESVMRIPQPRKLATVMAS